MAVCRVTHGAGFVVYYKLPTVRLWYARHGCLFTFGSLATDRDDRVYYSEEGCAQGDPLGPFLWAIGYHEALLRQQAAHPDTLIYAYLDDTYACDEHLFRQWRVWTPGRPSR